jgi:hypothetical protein
MEPAASRTGQFLCKLLSRRSQTSLWPDSCLQYLRHKPAIEFNTEKFFQQNNLKP